MRYNQVIKSAGVDESSIRTKEKQGRRDDEIDID